MASFTPQEIEQFLQQFFDTVGARQYVGARYVPIFGRAGSDTVEWDDTAPYEPLTVVMHEGVSYVSRRYVPTGIDIADTGYWAQTYRFNAQVEQYRQEVLTFQGQIDDIRDTMESDYVPFPDALMLPKYGTLGQVLTTLANGETKWEDPVVPSDAQAEAVITEWLNDHPEATTTVQDGSITLAKLATALKAALMQNRGFIAETLINDLNDATEAGFYTVASTTNVSNLPVNKAGTLLVYGTFTGTIRGTQIFISAENKIYTRTYTSNGWSTWDPIVKPLSVGTGELANGAVTEGKLADPLKALIPYLKGIISPLHITDLNTLKDPGMYVVQDYQVQNMPINSVGTLLVMGSATSNRTAQLFVSTTGILCWRGFTSSTQWSEWSVSNTIVRYSNELVLPARFDAAAGTQYDIEFYNMTTMFDIAQCNFWVSNVQNATDDKVWNMTEKIRVQKSTVGTRNLQITVKDSSGNDLAPTKTMVLNTVSTATKPTVKAIFIGDSLTDAGYYLAELQTIYGSNLTLYGTRSVTVMNAQDQDVTVLHEGHAGWSYNDLLTRQSYKDSSNAFYNPSTRQFDFSYYMTQNPTFSGTTDVFLFSGPNDGTNYTQFQTALAALCSSIKSYSSAIRIHIMTPTPPIRNGYGFAKVNASNYLAFKAAMLTHAKHVIDTYDGQSGYYVVPTHLCLDCWYDYAHTNVPVSARNPTIIEVGDNNVHPNRYGYYKISDVVYGHMLANCS